MVESPSRVRLDEPRRARVRADLVAVGIMLLVVAAATAVGVWLNRPGSGVVILAGAPPLFAEWLPHYGPGSVLAVLIAIGVVAWGPALATRLRRPALAGASYLASVAWIFSLAMIDGWHRGVTDRLTHPYEYLHEVPGITDIPAMLRGFSSRILDFQPDSWTMHVSGHPPAATLVFVWLDRLGLSGGAWAAVVCVLAGALVTVAVPATFAALGRGDQARAMLPFAVLFPGAVWVGVSADGMFAGVTATGVALLAFAAARRGRGAWAMAFLAGLVLGFGIFLSYGLVLLGLVALAVPLAARRPVLLIPAVVGALAVVAAFALAGFWWLDGYHLVVERYYQGIATERPYWYWVWGDLAAVALAAGPAVVAGVRRVLAHAVRTAPKQWNALSLVVVAAVLTIAFADLSGLSKAEVERIWLPFVVWALPATALLPRVSARWWLAGQAATALLVNHLVLTSW
ncbi:hypothetical protein HUW46_05324 [Amycolatopsis sp. CA-230715]|nr:hypothetical protein HUW46_05324 [Amycolatopsis sp. CA-230715]